MSRKKLQLSNHQSFHEGYTLQNDNIFVGGELVDVKEKTGLTPRQGLEKLFVVKDEIVNVVSNKYGLLLNEDFFGQIEHRLNEAGIQYEKRSINRDNRSFAVDYILSDDSLHINVKNGKDKIKPMIRAINSYDGSNQTTGHFGGYREICMNGLHIADMQLNFKQRHRGNVIEIVMPKIEDLIAVFMDNEFYSLHKKFEVLAEAPISNVEQFVQYTLGETGLFKYAKSEKNADTPSVAAQFVIDTINMEAASLNTKPNLWLGYNAFNEFIHTKNSRAFMLQEKADKSLFNAILEQVN